MIFFMHLATRKIHVAGITSILIKMQSRASVKTTERSWTTSVCALGRTERPGAETASPLRAQDKTSSVANASFRGDQGGSVRGAQRRFGSVPGHPRQSVERHSAKVLGSPRHTRRMQFANLLGSHRPGAVAPEQAADPCHLIDGAMRSVFGPCHGRQECTGLVVRVNGLHALCSLRQKRPASRRRSPP